MIGSEKEPSRRRVVVLGAGFGGLWAVRSLARSSVEVLLLDRNNYHTFLPLLYQVAAAELEPEEIVYPIRSILRRFGRVSFRLADVRSIDFVGRTVHTDGPAVPYDFLVLATGSTSNFFGIPGAAEHSFCLKVLEDGIALRNHILTCFERAAHQPDPEQRRRLLTFVIVGGGATGVEFSGALAELILRPLRKDFAGLDFFEVKVVLLEAAGALLQGFPGRHASYALMRLKAMGVDVRFRTPVAQIGEDGVRLKDGTTIPTETVVWTAGVRADPAVHQWGLPAGPAGRVRVLPTLQLESHPEVFVIGDLAETGGAGGPLPMTAPVAIQQGTSAGRNIARLCAGDDPLPFHFRDTGMMVTVGRNAAIATIGGAALTGFPAWLVWLTVHVAKLIGFRNRLFVLVNWAWDYLLYERTVRLILPGGHGARGRSEATGGGRH